MSEHKVEPKKLVMIGFLGAVAGGKSGLPSFLAEPLISQAGVAQDIHPVFANFAFEIIRQFALWLDLSLERLGEEELHLPLLRGPAGSCKDRDVAALASGVTKAARVYFQDTAKWCRDEQTFPCVLFRVLCSAAIPTSPWQGTLCAHVVPDQAPMCV
jgi:hypothetical protein